MRERVSESVRERKSKGEEINTELNYMDILYVHTRII